jgi:hypothetical protein
LRITCSGSRSTLLVERFVRADGAVLARGFVRAGGAVLVGFFARAGGVVLVECFVTAGGTVLVRSFVRVCGPVIARFLRADRFASVRCCFRACGRRDQRHRLGYPVSSENQESNF